jgi:hypothetical protein
MGDHAKKLLKIDPQEFSILSHEQQCARVQSLEFTQVCLLLRSSNLKSMTIWNAFGDMCKNTSKRKIRLDPSGHIYISLYTISL